MRQSVTAASGRSAGLLAPLAAGSAVIIPQEGRFAPGTFWRDAVQHRATFYTAVPTMHQILLARAGARCSIPRHMHAQVATCQVSCSLRTCLLRYWLESYGRGWTAAEKEYPRDAPPLLRFIRSCSSSLAGATLHKLEAAFHAPVLEVTLPPRVLPLLAYQERPDTKFLRRSACPRAPPHTT